MVGERPRPGRPKKPEARAKDIEGAKYMRSVMGLLAELRPHRDCPNRKLHFDEFVGYLLLFFFTPILTSLRGIQKASTLAALRKRMQLPRFSLGSFSEASRVFDPELVTPLLEKLLARAGNVEVDRAVAGLDLTLTAVDGTLLRALPKMTWALWVDEEHRAAKLHLHLDVVRGAPSRATLTTGRASEVKALREALTSGRLYVLDRGYASYSLLADILEARSSFVVRLAHHAAYRVVEERPLSEEAREQGVVGDALVHLGSRDRPAVRDRVLRLVTIETKVPPERWAKKKNRKKSKARSNAKRKRKARAQKRGRANKRAKEGTGTSEKTSTASAPMPEAPSEPEKPGIYRMLFVTDLLELDAELIGLIYRYRWQIELFFRWFKKVLQADRLLSLSKNGLTLVCYVALIASLLLTLWTGKKPTKRTFELICFFLYGLADIEDVLEHIERARPAAQ